ncbi:MAG: hypothetical protein V1791_11070 [Pseudomonadota bacterium]
MHDVEIDQSGRTDRLSKDTVLAFSDEIQGSILISAAVKRACYHKLRESQMRKKLACVRLFAAALAILLQDYCKKLELISIDLEYPGWEGEICRHLLRQLPELRKDQICFIQIGKKSPAHEVAWLTWRGEREPDKRVTVRELLEAC